jgi:2-polyprenyl-3-methyl-5-hydroxy-6-metoxy-1,4-benzoquinol methylase
MKTLDYYNKNASEYCEKTFSINLENIYTKFLSKLPEKSHILDAGCGSGRDSLYFINKGFEVDAFDGSPEICKEATKRTSLNVKNIIFENLDLNKEIYDGIWACSSLLHLNHDQLVKTIKTFWHSLKPSGVLYMSYKVGDRQGFHSGRFFYDMNSQRLKEICVFMDTKCQEVWVSKDENNREDIEWLNVISVKG